MPPMTLALFVWVLANQAGVPVPVVPALLAAGALASDGGVSIPRVLAVAVGAALGADLIWYGLGRWHGSRALAAGFRLLRVPPAAADRVESVFRAHRTGFLWSARFLPELNPVAAGLAGATRLTLGRFLRHAGGSALTWAGAWVGGGYLLGGTAPERLDPLGVSATVLIVSILAGVAVPAFTRIVRARPDWFTSAADPGPDPVPRVERRLPRPATGLATGHAPPTAARDPSIGVGLSPTTSAP